MVPEQTPQSPQQGPSRAGTAAGRGKRLKVLIVDDEQESLDLLERTLRGLYQTLRARDGREGLCCLERHSVAAVIADQKMPGMTGVEFLAEASHRFPYAQRVLLTGYTEVEGLIEAINAGRVFGYLSKPWHPDDLLATLRRAVETHQLLKDKDRLLKDLQRKNRELRFLLTETTKLQTAKMQAERWAALGKLASMVAHDLRNPLTAINCQAGLLRDEELESRLRVRSVDTILEQVRSMGHYIDDLLLFAKPKDPRSPPRPYALSALIASLQEAFSQRCQAEGVDLKVELAYKDALWISPPQIYRVLGNLLQNALEAVEQGGEILVVSEAINSKEIVIRIADSGPGIPASIRRTMFEPFVTSEKPDGTGLGLAIVRKIVYEHGGRIWEDPWRLKGACFHLILPKRPLGRRTGARARLSIARS